MVRLEAKHLTAFDAILAKTRHLKPQEVSRREFDHPDANGLLADILRMIQDGRGAVVVSGITHARYSEEEFERIYWGFGTHWGEAATQSAFGDRLGRNARYGSIGAGLGAAMLGACSIWGGERGVFALAAVLTALAAVAVRKIGPDRQAPVEDVPPEVETADWRASLRLLRDRRLLIFALCLMLFQVASIAVVQLAAVEATQRMGMQAGLVIAAFVIVPQIVAAWLAPAIGRFADLWGRRTVLLAGFATVPIRNALFAVIRHPVGLIPVQALEGAGGAVFGIMMPLVAADLTRTTGFYTSCLSILSLAGTLGTAISTSMAGWLADHLGRPVTYWILAAIGLLALTVLATAMPETGKPKPRPDPQPTKG